MFQKYDAELEFEKCPEIWQSSQLIKSQANSCWDKEKGRLSQFAAAIPFDTLSHGYLKKCYETYQSRSEALGIACPSYKAYTQRIHRALALKYDVETGLEPPVKPKSIRLVNYFALQILNLKY